MQSYLITGYNRERIQSIIDKLLKEHSLQRLDYDLKKIADLRELANFVKLRIGKPTAIVIKNIERATDEALNAFLKNLEEPQKDLYYILTSRSSRNLLPTIVSRCQVVNTGSSNQPVDDITMEFEAKTIGEKLDEVAKIKDREDAISFIEEYINYTHTTILRNPIRKSEDLEVANNSRKNLLLYGNVSLQLTNFVIQLAE